MKFRILLILLFVPYLVSAQREIKAEWINEDVSMFQYFFNTFPLKSTTNEADLLNTLKRFKDAECKSIGFGAVLYWWCLPGGTITIKSNIVSYCGKIAMVETTIDQDDIKRLSYVFERDKTIKNNFFKLFKLQVNKNYFNDSVYLYTYTNDSVFQEYRNQVNKQLGEQKILDLSQSEFEFNLLNKPTGRYQYDGSYFNNAKDYPPVLATQKLINEKQTDCLFNIIKGNSLPGRLYGITAILQMVRDNKYRMTIQDKVLIKKVLNMDLYVEGGYHLVSYKKYANCINDDLLKILEK